MSTGRKSDCLEIHRSLNTLHPQVVRIAAGLTARQEWQRLYEQAGVPAVRKELRRRLQGLDRQLEGQLREAAQLYREIRGRLHALPAGPQRQLLADRYLNCLTMEQIAQKRGMALRRACRLRRRALMHLLQVDQTAAANRQKGR